MKKPLLKNVRKKSEYSRGRKQAKWRQLKTIDAIFYLKKY